MAKCKYGTVKTKNGSIRRNIVELAEEGDWIAGTGGVNLSKSAGHGMYNRRGRCDLDVLLTCNTVQEIERAMKKRRDEVEE